jgi:hypothetical protein
VDCSKLSEKEIFSLELNTANMSEEQCSLLKQVDILGIDSRYALVRIPHLNRTYGLPQYSQLFLLDADENTCQIVPDKLGADDTLLSLDEIKVDNDGRYLMIKTGNVAWFEKRDFWEVGRKDYFDQLESLVLIDTESFINYIKNETQIPDSFIIDKCSFESAFTNICIINGTLKYQKVSFTDNATEFISYDINSKQTKKINIEGIYETIYNINESIFAVTADENSKSIIDVKNSKCIYSTITPAEQIVYFDNENVITAIPQEGLKHEIINHSIIDNKVDKLGFGWFTFNDRQKILTIFN